MILLYLLGYGSIVILGVLLVTQILIPAATGKKLFPAFRPNPLRDQVELTREEVENLQEQTKNLRELAALKAAKAALEQQVGSVDNQEKKDAQ